MKSLHHDNTDAECPPDELGRMLSYPVFIDKGRLLEPLDQHEVYDRGNRYTTEDPSEIGERLLIIKGEEDTGDPLDY